ncbi:MULTISPECIES: vitamin K epoxide reductase family protein [Streptomyces]|uniref:Vitamin K epoxide reductase family protein n=2 Tax=Streptomyces TaxID=1883 RepID=A0ABU2RQL7_9ACTN|nr:MULTISPECIES: vitamin K epoxide reductase family protein [unclassified Streptomyces]MBK3593080.1 vitamin K epoxide reductase family protein [Streptomyces sp. MBT51]MDT0429659.1 vitamin K epoxide reductase family protein [Streptomyces sp. DSM 41770]
MTVVERGPVPAAVKSADDAEAPVRVGARRGFGWLLVITAALGLWASFVITVDKFELLGDPDFVPACSLNPVLSCTDVMRSEQASVFGFPNPLIGLIAFAVLLGTGAGLLAGARYRRWYWLGLNAGTLAGAVFCVWLMTQALYDIGALCLWCVLVWMVTVLAFWHTTLHNLRHGVLPAPRALVAAALEFPLVVPVTWCLVVLTLIGTRFWSYWQTLL